MARMIQILCKIDGEPFLIAPRQGKYPTICEAHRNSSAVKALKADTFLDSDGTLMWLLKCRTCKSMWYKEAGRNRKPVNCFNCTAPKVKVSSAKKIVEKNPTFIDADGVKQQLLKCEDCSNVWYRKSAKGKAPRNCYDCKNAPKPGVEKTNAKGEKVTSAPTMMENGIKYQILHCETGNHSWKRKSARGKAPRNCNESHDGSVKLIARSPEAIAQIHETVKALTDTVKSFETISAETRLANIAARRAAYMAQHSKSTMYGPMTAVAPVKPKATRKPRRSKAAV